MLVLLTLSSGCSVYSAGPWRGTVLDADTKQPIEGAAVVMVWQTQQEGGFAAVFHYLDSEERLTDKDGRFEIGAKSFTQTRGLSKVYGPKMVIFKPGYGSYPRYQVSPKPFSREANPGIFEKDGAVVELPKFKTKEERWEKIPSKPLDDRYYNKIPNFIKLQKQELKETN